MCDIMNAYRVPKGYKLLDYMQTESAVRFLGKGAVKCVDHYNGKSFVYDFRIAPIVLSETVSFLNNTPSRITLETIDTCEFLELPRASFLKLMSTRIDIAMFTNRGVGNYLGMTHYKYALLRSTSAEERYKLFLEEFPYVARCGKLEDIASYINLTPSSLSRIRNKINWRESESHLKALNNELEVLHNRD